MAALRVILKHDIHKLLLPARIPSTLEQLKLLVEMTFVIEEDFTLHYEDKDFDGQFFTLITTDQIKDKDSIKVVSEAPVVMTFTPDLPEFNSSPSPVSLNPSNDSSSPGSSVSSTNSTASTIILNSPGSASLLRSVSWPAEFDIPTFSLDIELFLQAANESYRRDGTTINNVGVKSRILEKLAESIFIYTPYPSGAQREQVAEALVAKHPCLRDPVAANGIDGWLHSIKYKLGNNRAKVRQRGLPELSVNSLKKAAGDDTPAKNLKKAKKSEVNYLPPHPPGETEETLEEKRVELLYEFKKRDNNRVVNEKMSQTFSLRRQDVIQKKPCVIDFKARWPALFEPSQIEEEFRRITVKPLQSAFLQNLDKLTPKLLSLYRKKGGASGKRLADTLDVLHEDNSIETRRDAVIRGLIIYLGEKTEDLIKHYKIIDGNDADRIQEAVSTLTLSIFMVTKADQDTKAGIAIEGAEVFFGCPDLAHACTYLMGCIYALELSYPKQLKYTFEVFQKVLLKLEDSSKRMSSKVHDLLLCLRP